MTTRTQATYHEQQAIEDRVRAKFLAFYEGLPAEEQQALDAGIARALAGADGDDTSGYSFGTSPVRVLDLWTVRAAYVSPGSRLDQEMEHGIAAGCATGKHFPGATL